MASVTVKLYVPAPLVNVPVPVYGAVPPVAVTVTVVVPPLQSIAAPAEEDAANCCDGPGATVALTVELHPLPSVTVNV